jgi:hypothetical protein
MFILFLKHNLISVGQLTQKGYRVSFENNVCTILDIPPSKMVIAKIKMDRQQNVPTSHEKWNDGEDWSKFQGIKSRPSMDMALEV